MKKSSIAMLFSALSLIATFSASAQAPEKMLPLAVEVEVITVFVMDVDLQNRTSGDLIRYFIGIDYISFADNRIRFY